jgi:hypothetical protein
MTNDTAFERHYTITELAKLWQVSFQTVWRFVQQEPDVMRITGPSGKVSYRIPESVARRIHTKLITPQKKQPQLVAK